MKKMLRYIWDNPATDVSEIYYLKDLEKLDYVELSGQLTHWGTPNEKEPPSLQKWIQSKLDETPDTEPNDDTVKSWAIEALKDFIHYLPCANKLVLNEHCIPVDPSMVLALLERIISEEPKPGKKGIGVSGVYATLQSAVDYEVEARAKKKADLKMEAEADLTSRPSLVFGTTNPPNPPFVKGSNTAAPTPP